MTNDYRNQPYPDRNTDEKGRSVGSGKTDIKKWLAERAEFYNDDDHWLEHRTFLEAAQRIEELEAQNTVIPVLLSLLDQIEIKDDASLAAGRFQILKDIGFDVVWTGKASGEVQ